MAESKEVVGYLQREYWGPRFWKILHTLAETSGRQAQVILNNDEADAWIQLLKLQQFVMPCALCKEHYSQWRTGHSLVKLKSLIGLERRTFLREWLCGCHNRVNKLNGKPTVEVNDLPSLYPRKSIQKEVEELNPMFQLAITQQKLKFEEVRIWKNVLQRLRIVAGV